MTVSPMASGRSRGSAVGNAPGAVVGPGGRWSAAAAWWLVAAPRGGWRPPRRSARGWMAAWTKTPARCGASHRLLLPVGAPSSPLGLWHWPRAALLESSTLGLAAADAPAAAPSRCCSCSAASASSRRGHHEVNESCAGSMAGSVPGPLLSSDGELLAWVESKESVFHFAVSSLSTHFSHGRVHMMPLKYAAAWCGACERSASMRPSQQSAGQPPAGVASGANRAGGAHCCSNTKAHRRSRCRCP